MGAKTSLEKWGVEESAPKKKKSLQNKKKGRGVRKAEAMAGGKEP